MIKIAIDALGGDYGLDTTVPAAMQAVKECPDIELYLYGDEEKISSMLTNKERIHVIHTTNVLDMGEHNAIRAVRNNRDASLCMALRAGKNKEVDAVVSNGPTQCVVVGAHLIVRRLPGMSRVALCPVIPSLDGSGRLMLDVGANVNLEPEHLVELATYATVVAKEVFKMKNPRVGLLNIGTEPGKGREVDQKTYDLLEANENIEFFGNVETKEILSTPCEILLTDGFTGNMVMKTIEGTAKSVGVMLKEEIKKTFFGKIGYLFMRHNLDNFKKRVSPDDVGGAMILGIGTPVVKAHGSSDPVAYKNAILLARKMVEEKVIEKVVNKLPKDEA